MLLGSWAEGARWSWWSNVWKLTTRQSEQPSRDVRALARCGAAWRAESPGNLVFWKPGPLPAPGVVSSRRDRQERSKASVASRFWRHVPRHALTKNCVPCKRLAIPPRQTASIHILSSLAHRRFRMRRAPLSTTSAMTVPITKSGYEDPVHATSAPATITPALAITSFAEKI